MGKMDLKSLKAKFPKNLNCKSLSKQYKCIKKTPV